MDIYIALKLIHIIGACVLLGTGIGIAFFMLMAHRTGDAKIIAHTASIVIIADWLFTAVAVVAQPVSGVLLALKVGWSLTEGWLLLSLVLYLAIGFFWLPVVWIQYRLRHYAQNAALTNSTLPESYFSLFRIWFICGFPAFTAVLVIIWLMIAKPIIGTN